MLDPILIVGGDRRALCLYQLLIKEGRDVRSVGLRPNDHAEIGEANTLLFPYPYAVRNGLVPTLNGATIHPADVLAAAKPTAVVMAGAGLDHEHVLSYMRDDGFMQHNAELSAEAAVSEAMQRAPEALMDISVLVTGYGRFGRALALRLHALGATVWVAARREAQRLHALSDGMHAVPPEEIASIAPKLHMVLSAAPAQMIDERVLEALPKEAILLELASAPFGFDRERAKAHGLIFDVLPALPARYAPMSAARALLMAAKRLSGEVRI